MNSKPKQMKNEKNLTKNHLGTLDLKEDLTNPQNSISKDADIPKEQLSTHTPSDKIPISDTNILNTNPNFPEEKMHPFEIVFKSVGILIARAVPYPGCAPFGLSFMSSEKRFGTSALISFAATVIGYATLFDMQMSVKYICCTIAYLLFLFITDSKGKDLPSAVAVGGASVISLFGSITEAIILGFSPGLLIKALFDTTAVAVCGAIFDKISLILKGRRHAFFSMNKNERICLIVTGCILLLGLGDLQIPTIISIKALVSLFATLLFGLGGGAGIGAICGTICGFLGGYTQNPLYLASVLAVCGTVAGTLNSHSRYTVSLSSALAAVIGAVYCSLKGEPIFCYVDIPAAAILAALVPESYIRNLRRILGIKSQNKDIRIRDYIHERLQITSSAFLNLAGTLFSLSDKDSEPDIEDAAVLFDSVADRVCRNCSGISDCWVQNYDNTYRGLFKMLENLERKGSINESETESALGKHCLKVRSLTREMNSLYEIYRINSIWKSKLCENRDLAAQQLADVSRILDSVSQEIYEEHIDSGAEEEIRMRLSAKGYEVTELDVTIGAKKRYFAYIGALAGEDSDGLRRCAETALRVILGTKMVMIGAVRKDCDEIVMRFAQPEGYVIETGISTGCASAKSGDVCTMRYLSDGKFAAALSDGMGTGKRAARDSLATVRLLGDFLEAGFDKTIAVKLINSIMVMKSAEEAFATVDMCVIDLFSGTAEFIKNGAEPCFIKRGYDIETVRSTSLPVGVIRDMEVETFAHKLSHGNTVVMMSDGILVNSNNCNTYFTQGGQYCQTKDSYTDIPIQSPNQYDTCGKENIKKTDCKSIDNKAVNTGYDNTDNRKSGDKKADKFNDKNDWIKSMIADSDPDMPAQELADRLLEMSKMLHGGKCTDDMTVSVIKLYRRK